MFHIRKFHDESSIYSFKINSITWNLYVKIIDSSISFQILRKSFILINCYCRLWSITGWYLSNSFFFSCLELFQIYSFGSRWWRYWNVKYWWWRKISYWIFNNSFTIHVKWIIVYILSHRHTSIAVFIM